MGIDWRVATDTSARGTQYQNNEPSRTEGALYEPVLVRSSDSSVRACQPVFQIYSDQSEWPIGDLFTPHPTKTSAWKYAGRADDLIVFATGGKFHPTGTEERLKSAHPDVQTVLMWGTGHRQAMLLVDLTDEGFARIEDAGAEGLKSDIWRTVQEHNMESQSVAQIARTHIMFATREKAIPRTPKGTVKRGEAAEMYKAEIENMYRQYGDVLPNPTARVR